MLAISNSSYRSLALTKSSFTRKKTVIVSECVLVYIEEASIQKLKSFFRGSLNNFVMIDYEMFNPADAFGRRMVMNFEVF